MALSNLNSSSTQKSSFASVLLQNFNIEYNLGEGAYGFVYKAKELETNNVFAVKMIRLTSDYNHAKAIQEVNVIARLQHPNIVNFIDSWCEKPPKNFNDYPYTTPITETNAAEGVLFLQVEFCDRNSLRHWLQSDWRNPSDAKRFFHQVVCGLAFMHSHSVIHRDLKPENIMLTNDEEMESIVAKIGDFGTSTEPKTKMTTDRGTQGYIAPEVKEKGKNLTSMKSDIYSLGVTFFNMMFSSDVGNDEVPSHRFYETIFNESGDFDFKKCFPGTLDNYETRLIRDMTSLQPKQRPSAKEIQDRNETESPADYVGVVVHPFELQVIGTPEKFKLFPTILEKRQLSLRHLELNYLELDAEEFSASIELLVNLVEIRMENISVEGIYKQINLPRLKRFTYHEIAPHNQANCDISWEDFLEIMTLEKLRGICFFGALDRTWKENLEINVRVGKYIALDIRPTLGEIMILTDATADILENLHEFRNLSKVSASFIGEEIKKNVHIPNGISSLNLSGVKFNLESGCFLSGYKNLSELILVARENIIPRQICLVVLPKTLRKLCLEFYEIIPHQNPREVPTLPNLEILALSECPINEEKYIFAEVYTQMFQPKVFHVYPGLNEGTAYCPTFALLSTILNTECEEIFFADFKWESEDISELKEFLLLSKISKGSRHFMLRCEDSNWLGKSVHGMGIVNMNKEIFKREIWETPGYVHSSPPHRRVFRDAPIDKEVQLHSPSDSNTRLIPLQKNFGFELRSFFFEDGIRDFNVTQLSKIPNKNLLQKIWLKNIEIQGSSFVQVLFGCVNLMSLTLLNVRVDGFFTGTVPLPKLKEFNFVESRLLRDTADVRQYITSAKLKSILFFTKVELDLGKLCDLGINILVGVSNFKILEINHDLKEVVVQYFDFEASMPSPGQLCPSSFSSFKSNVDIGGLDLKLLTYLNLNEVKQEIFDMLFKGGNEFPNLHTFYFEPLENPRHCNKETDLSLLPPSLRTVGFSGTRIKFPTRYACQSFTFNNCIPSGTIPYLSAFLMTLEVDTLALFSGPYFSSNYAILSHLPDSCKYVYVVGFDWKCVRSLHYKQMAERLKSYGIEEGMGKFELRRDGDTWQGTNLGKIVSSNKRDDEFTGYDKFLCKRFY